MIDIVAIIMFIHRFSELIVSTPVYGVCVKLLVFCSLFVILWPKKKVWHLALVIASCLFGFAYISYEKGCFVSLPFFLGLLTIFYAGIIKILSRCGLIEI